MNQSTRETVENLRIRLRKMTIAELLDFGKAALDMCSPATNLGWPPQDIHVIQLREATEEWKRRARRKKMKGGESAPQYHLTLHDSRVPCIMGTMSKSELYAYVTKQLGVSAIEEMFRELAENKRATVYFENPFGPKVRVQIHQR
jgi:hypothetical protein